MSYITKNTTDDAQKDFQEYVDLKLKGKLESAIGDEESRLRGRLVPVGSQKERYNFIRAFAALGNTVYVLPPLSSNCKHPKFKDIKGLDEMVTKVITTLPQVQHQVSPALPIVSEPYCYAITKGAGKAISTTCVAFFDAGNCCARGNQDGSITINDVVNKNQTSIDRVKDCPVSSIAVIGDGAAESQWLVCGLRDGSLWRSRVDGSSRTILQNLHGRAQISAMTAMNRSGTLILTGGGRTDGTVRELDLMSMKCQTTIKVSSLHGISCIANARTGGDTFVVGAYKSLRVLDRRCNSGSLQMLGREHTYHGHKSHVVACDAVGENVHMFVSGDKDGIVKVWDIRQTQKSLSTITSHTTTRRARHLVDVKAFDSGHRFATCSSDNTVKLWDVKSSQCIGTITGDTQDAHALSCHVQGDSHGWQVQTCTANLSVVGWFVPNTFQHHSTH